MNIKIKALLYTILYFFFGVLQVSAQTINDSQKYNELSNSVISKNGKISVVYKYYKFEAKRDSVFIFNNGKLVLSKQTNLLYEQFKDNSFSSYNIEQEELEILDGTTFKTHIISNVANPILMPDLGLVFYLETNTNTYKLIKVLPNKIQEIWSNPNSLINFTNISDDKLKLLIQYKDLEKGVEIIDLINFKKTLNKDITHPIKQAKWSKKHTIVFLLPISISDDKYPYLTFYNYKTNSSEKCTLNDQVHYNDLESISNNSFKITQFYSLGRKPYNTKAMEIWSTKDRFLRNILANSTSETNKTDGHIIFDYAQQKVYQPEALDNHESVPINDNTLLVYDSNQYYNYSYQWSSRPRDINLYDIKHNKLTNIVKQQESPFNTTSLSPRGNYFIYIKDDTVYFYNILNRIVESTFKTKHNYNGLKVSRLRAWSDNERFFYFVSDFNLMQYDTKNKEFKMIIKSNNLDSRYEILNTSLDKSLFNTKTELHFQSVLNNNNTLLIKISNIKNNTQSLILIENGQEKTIVKNTKDYISDIKYSENFKTITYSLENFNKPKTVYVYQNDRTNLLLENTMSKSLYAWKKQKIVFYKDQYGNNLKGVLFYPKDFDPYKKYPMITHIYEIQNYLANRFTYPSYLNEDGFNLTLLQENNYFIFYPDILDTHQGTGLSALHCVEESLKSVLKEETAIDEENLGLFGFSHGGYQTNFIMTQTNLFKAAVSGAGNSDIIRSYFSYNENFTSPFFFQFENGQYKMPKTFSEDKEQYLLNSPILFADQIKAPILTFTGKKDENIHWEQQREFFIAMLRYNIPHVALFYKEEGHGLSKQENQIDITKRLFNWFDYFLKGENTPDTYWVKYNTTFEENRMIN